MTTETISHYGYTITLTRKQPDGMNKAWVWEAAKPNGGSIVGYRPTRAWALIAAKDAVFENNYSDTLAAERRSGG
jgi:hypothetical protein